MLKALAILSATTVKKSAVEQENLKPIWKSTKDHISRGDRQALKILLAIRRNISGGWGSF